MYHMERYCKVGSIAQLCGLHSQAWKQMSLCLYKLLLAPIAKHNCWVPPPHPYHLELHECLMGCYEVCTSECYCICMYLGMLQHYIHPELIISTDLYIVLSV